MPAEFPAEETEIEPWDIPELLASLTEKSLVVWDESSGRYRLLETVREYGEALLAQSDEADRRRDLHRDAFVHLARSAAEHMIGPEQADWLDRLDDEHDNLRAALGWAVGEGRPEEGGTGEGAPSEGGTPALRIAASLARFWEIRGFYREGREWYARALEGAPAGGSVTRSAARAAALYGGGILAFRQAEYPAARALLEEAMAGWRAAGDRAGMAAALSNLGNVTLVSGQEEEARGIYEEALSLARELGDGDRQARILYNLAVVHLQHGEPDRAEPLLEESLRLHEADGNRAGVLYDLGSLGNVARARRDFDRARELYHESLRLCLELQDRQNAAYALTNLGEVALDQERFAEAARLGAAAEALRAQVGAPLLPAQRELFTESVRKAREGLGEAEFAAAWEEGSRMTLEEAAEYTLPARAVASRSPHPGGEGITRRDR